MSRSRSPRPPYTMRCGRLPTRWTTAVTAGGASSSPRTRSGVDDGAKIPFRQSPTARNLPPIIVDIVPDPLEPKTLGTSRGRRVLEGPIPCGHTFACSSAREQPGRRPAIEALGILALHRCETKCPPGRRRDAASKSDPDRCPRIEGEPQCLADSPRSQNSRASRLLRRTSEREPSSCVERLEA